MMQRPILVLASDAALSGLIARSLRLQGIYAKPLPMTVSAGETLSFSPCGIIWATPQKSGGDVPIPDEVVQKAGIPMLVLGEAATALCLSFGGKIAGQSEGAQSVTLGLSAHPLFGGIAGGGRKLHGLDYLSLSQSMEPLVTATEQCIGFVHKELPLYAMEYPIEHNDPDVGRLLYNFSIQICGALTDWNEAAVIQQAVQQIRNAAGNAEVLCAVSGGLDSAVCAKLAHMAVGDRLRCVFIDNGLLRKGEGESIPVIFETGMGLTVHTIDAGSRFLSALAQVEGFEEKQRITATLLEQVLRNEMSSHPGLQSVIIGTNLNDLLQPHTAEEAEPSLALRVIEPLRDLFKEEVRRIGFSLALPDSILHRQSFPSGGLALRIAGRICPKKLALSRTVNAFFDEEICTSGHEKRLWQYYAFLMDSQTACGTYMVMLRAMHTAQNGPYAARLPYDLLERVTQRIRSEAPEVGCVAYDLTPDVLDDEQE